MDITEFGFSLIYRLLSKGSILKFATTPILDSGQLTSNKEHLENANELQERKTVQAVAC